MAKRRAEHPVLDGPRIAIGENPEMRLEQTYPACSVPVSASFRISRVLHCNSLAC